MFHKTLTTFLLFLSFGLYAQNVYEAPDLKLHPEKGQTSVIPEEDWDSPYRVHEDPSKKREIASEEFDWERSPSSNKDKNKSEYPHKMQYWEFNQKLP